MERQTLTIDAEVAAWLEKQPKKVDPRKWRSDPLTDAKLLAGWKVMKKQDLVKALGVCEKLLRERYRELTGGEA